MFSQYDPTVNATIAFLKMLGAKVNDATVNETLQNHPNWPSLLCISDSLQSWNIPHAAGRLSIEDIDQLQVPFIAVTRDPRNQVVIVTEVTARQVGYYSPGLKRSIRSERAVFLNNWNGIYLLAEVTKESGEKGYEKVKQKILLQTFVPSLLLLFLTALSFYGLQTVFRGKTGLTVYIQYIVYLSGVIITSLLLWYEIDRNNPLLKKICTGFSKGSCESILTSSRAKLLGWLSWSEVGSFYFTGSLLALLFVPGSVNILSLLTLLVMPYIIFSVYYQWLVVKRWCALCLGVQALLLIGGINTLTGPFIRSFTLSADLLLKGTACFIFPILCWYSIKPHFLRLQQAVTLRREYLRLKFNTEIFDTILKKQKAITRPVANLGIDLGKADAKNTLIKVCNPYCGPCASAHQKIEKLLEKHNNLRVKIIFTATSNKDDIKSKPVKHLMAITEKQNEALTKKALDDWYLSKKQDYDVFATHYPMNGELLVQDHKLEAMAVWCREMEVFGTPTFYLNGYQLPDAYNIEDLEYFLLA